MPKNFQVIIHAVSDGELFSNSVIRCSLDLLRKKLTIDNHDGDFHTAEEVIANIQVIS